MSKDDFKIDRTLFGRIARSIYDPHSPVVHILHVRDHSRLATLADLLAWLKKLDQLTPANISTLLAPSIREDTVRVSSSNPDALGEVGPYTHLWDIPRLARCDVIRLPPFYLAHTPGLFEGKLSLRAERLRHLAAHRMRL